MTSPALAGGVKGVKGNRRLVQGQSEFAEPASAASVAMEGMPESGTAARAAGRVATGLAAGGQLLPAIASMLGPLGAGRVLMSGPVQRQLMRAPEQTRALLTSIIAAHQGEAAR